MRKLALGLVFLGIAWYVAAPFYYFSIMCHSGMDLGLFTQRIYTFTRGNYMMVDTLMPKYSQWVDHFSPIMLFLIPIGMLPEWAMPLGLVAVQSYAFIAASFFIFKIGVREGLSATNARLIQGAFLLHPYFMHLSLFDFHPVALAPYFIVAAVYYVDNKRMFLTFAFGLCLLKETALAMAVGLILYAYLHYKKNYLPWLAMPVLGGIIFLALLYFIPHEGPMYYFGNRLGAPLLFPRHLLLMHAWMLLPLGFMLNFSWALLIAIPEYLLELFAKNSFSLLIFYQYHTSVVTALVIALIHCWRNWYRYFLVVGILAGLIIFSPVSVTFMKDECLLNRPMKLGALSYLADIPREATVCADNWAIPIVSARHEVHFINNVTYCDYTVMDVDSPWNKERMNKTVHDEQIADILARKQPIFNQSGILVFEGQ